MNKHKTCQGQSRVIVPNVVAAVFDKFNLADKEMQRALKKWICFYSKKQMDFWRWNWINAKQCKKSRTSHSLARK